MTKPTPAWHAEAKKLYADGATPAEIARIMGRSHACVAYAIDHMGARKKALERKNRSRAGVTAHRIRPAVRRSVERPVAPPQPEEQSAGPRKPTLPHISIPDLDGPIQPPVLRFAPRTRLTSSPGAERIREIHRRMVREGRFREPEPGLPEQLHH